MFYGVALCLDSQFFRLDIAPMLLMQDMTKSFLGIRVLHSVSLDLAPGEVHAVVGENGAGKSTLMKLLSGEHTPDGGRIEIDGTPHAFGHPAQADRKSVV